MHNSSFANVNVGDMVSTGQIIAYAGSTGVSTGPHCHLQVIYDGDYMNAMLFLYGGNQGIAALNAEGNLVPINVDGSPNSLGTNWDTYYSRTSDGRWILKNGEEN